MRRRAFLQLVPVAGVGVSGCSENGSPNGAGGTSTASGIQSSTEAATTERATVEEAGATTSRLGYLDSIRRSTAPRNDSAQRRMTYTQMYRGQETRLTIDVPEALIEYYRRRKRIQTYGSYVSDGYDDEYISFLASRFTEYGTQESLSADRIVDHAMAFVQQLEYTTDEVGTGFNEYPKYPVETLADQGGDCEDTSILLAAILQELGYDCILLLIPEANHAALGIRGEDIDGFGYDHQGHRYYYVESTAPGWRVGRAPEEVQDVPAKFVPIADSPSLVVAWAIGTTDSEVRIEAVVRNVGKGIARDARVGFDLRDESGRVLSRSVSDSVSIQVHDEHRFRTAVKSPPPQPLSARVSLLIGDTIHDIDETPLHNPEND